MTNRNSVLWSRESERKRLIAEAKRILRNINDQFHMVEQWNQVRPEAYINPDPNGDLTQMREQMQVVVTDLEGKGVDGFVN